MMNSAMKSRFKPVVMNIEGYQNHPYEDIYGNITIGIGHNLTANPVSDEVISKWFDDDVDYFYDRLFKTFAWFHEKSEPVQMALVYMAFNLGWEKFLTFKKFLAAMDAGNMPKAIAELKDSRYYEQVTRGARAILNALACGTFSV